MNVFMFTETYNPWEKRRKRENGLKGERGKEENEKRKRRREGDVGEGKEMKGEGWRCRGGKEM